MTCRHDTPPAPNPLHAPSPPPSSPANRRLLALAVAIAEAGLVEAALEEDDEKINRWRREVRIARKARDAR